MVVAATVASPPRGEARAQTGWDSRVLLLRGEDRAHLIQRIADFESHLEREPNAPLAELAASAATEIKPGGARLGLVTTSVDDLRTKLRRATARLADPKCRQIRDA